MLKGIILILLLGLVPVILGIPWTKVFQTRYAIAFAYGFGFFTELALFHIIAFILTYLDVDFQILVWLYSILLALACAGSMIYSYKKGIRLHPERIKELKTFAWHEWILLIAFVGLVGYQVYRGFTNDLTYMSHDDALYTTMANDALTTGRMALIDAYTGEATSLNMQRAIQTSLIFPAYMTAFSGINVATMEHTVQYIQMILLAYTIYVFIAGELFEKRENQLIFLVILATFFIFGYHSHYSLTFRLLGPNYQGKAVLAVSMTPLIFAFLLKALEESYDWKKGMMLFILSLASMSLTNWSSGTLAVIIILPIILSFFRKERSWKHFLYIPWALIMPVVFVALYGLYEFAV